MMNPEEKITICDRLPCFKAPHSTPALRIFHSFSGSHRNILGHQSLPPTNLGRLDEEMVSTGRGSSQSYILDFVSKNGLNCSTTDIATMFRASRSICTVANTVPSLDTAA
ncbi:hypothetical protein TNCV_4618171 [Trichonephila clavipes]|nr:hypothetical protein TNCV_4618171 [Trichonephila clavipes]